MVSCYAGRHCGLSSVAGGGHDTDLLAKHQWQGIGVAVFSWLAGAVQADWVGNRLARLYLSLLTIALVLLGVAGHHGGSLGQTNEFGYNVVNDPVHVHDFQTTVLHLMGIDHEKLTFKSQGRRYRLTDVHGNVVKPLLA